MPHISLLTIGLDGKDALEKFLQRLQKYSYPFDPVHAVVRRVPAGLVILSPCCQANSGQVPSHGPARFMILATKLNFQKFFEVCL